MRATRDMPMTRFTCPACGFEGNADEVSWAGDEGDMSASPVCPNCYVEMLSD